MVSKNEDKNISSSQSPKRTATRTQRKARSPARTKSPARKTPDRKSGKSPTRSRGRSTERLAKVAKPTAKPENKSKSEKKIEKVALTKIKENLDSLSSDEDIIETVTKEKPKAAVRGSKRKDSKIEENKLVDVKSIIQESTSYGEIRRITRQSAILSEPERVFHLKEFESTKKLGEFSDDDDVKEKYPIIKQQKKLSFLLLFNDIISISAVPFLLYLIYFVCFKSYCMLDYRVSFKNIHSYYHLQSVLGYSSFVTLLSIFSCIPIYGRKISSLPSKQPKFVYFTNGLISMTIFLSVAVASEIYGFPVVSFIVQRIAFFIFPAFVFGVLLSLFLFFKSFQAPIYSLNTEGVEKSNLHGFVIGREVNPRLFNIFDVKLFLAALWSISMILLETALLVKGLGLKTSYSTLGSNLQLDVLSKHPTLIALYINHFIYAFDTVLFEKQMLTTYFFQYEGLGYYNVLAFTISPLLFAAQIKYVSDYKTQLPHWLLGSLVTLYIIGYLIFRISNNQKDSFRRNPYSSTSTGLDVIPTSHGKKLLASGLWGVIRRPNVFGDFLVHLSLLLFTYNTPLSVFYGLILINLVIRAVKGESVCREKYKGGWEKYCQRVKYVLLPKVY